MRIAGPAANHVIFYTNRFPFGAETVRGRVELLRSADPDRDGCSSHMQQDDIHGSAIDDRSLVTTSGVGVRSQMNPGDIVNLKTSSSEASCPGVVYGTRIVPLPVDPPGSKQRFDQGMFIYIGQSSGRERVGGHLRSPFSESSVVTGQEV